MTIYLLTADPVFGLWDRATQLRHDFVTQRIAAVAAVDDRAVEVLTELVSRQDAICDYLESKLGPVAKQWALEQRSKVWQGSAPAELQEAAR